MKVALLWPYFPPDPGAASARGIAYARLLESHDHDVVIVSKNNNPDKYQNSKTKIRRLPIKVSINPIVLLTSYRKILHALESTLVDIIIASSPPPLFIFITALIAQKIDRPFIADLRDQFTATKNGVIQKKIYAALLRWSYNKAACLFVTTQMQKKDLLDHFPKLSTPIEIIPNGIELDHYPISQAFKSIKTIDLVHLGSINPERDPEKIIKLIECLVKQKPELKIRFIGVDLKQPWVRDFILEMPQNSKDRIELIPELPHTEAFTSMSQATIGLLSIANRKEIRYQLPVKLFEYLAAGLIVAAIAPDKKNEIRSFIVKNKVGIVNSSPDILGEQIIQLLHDQKKCKALTEHNIILSKKYDRRRTQLPAIGLIERYADQ